MDIRAAAVERVLARDPHGSLEETLTQLMAETQAACTGLFLGRGDAQLLGAVGVDQACLDRVRAAWRREADRFRDGRPLWSGAWCVWPCGSCRGVLLVYLAGPALKLPLVRDAVTGVADLLDMLVGIDPVAPDPQAYGRASQTAVDLYLRATTPEEVERRQLTIVLNESEWNIARAARVLGVTRITIYKRMQRLRIERLKVRRSEPQADEARG